MKRYVVASTLITLLVIAAATLFTPDWRARIVGVLQNESFFCGMPLSYWTTVADDDDAERRAQAIEVLVETSKHRDPKVSGEAFKALAKVAPEKQLFGLIQHLKRESPNDWSDRQEQRPARGGLLMSRVRRLEETLDLAGREELVPLFTDALKYKDGSEFGNDAEIREIAARFLAKIGPKAKASVPALVVALEQDSSIKVRTEAAEALGAIRADANIAVPALVKALKDEDLSLRVSVASALKELDTKIAEEAAAPMIIPVLAKNLQDKDERVRKRSAEVLGKLRLAGQMSVSALAEALKDESSLVRKAAAHSLGQFGPVAKPSAPALTSALKDSIRIEAALALWRIEPQNDLTLSLLRQELGSKDSGARCQAALALGNLAPNAKGEAAAALIPLLKDKDWHAQEEAARILGQFGAEARPAMPSLIQTLGESEGYFGGFVRIQVALALWRIDRRGDLAFPVLRQGLTEPTLTFRAIAAFGDLGPEGKAEAVAALTPLLKSDDWEFRLAARYALKRIDPDAAAKLGVR